MPLISLLVPVLARFGDEETAGSNPATPTNQLKRYVVLADRPAVGAK
jgi:hypothetical protein